MNLILGAEYIRKRQICQFIEILHVLSRRLRTTKIYDNGGDGNLLTHKSLDIWINK